MRRNTAFLDRHRNKAHACAARATAARGAPPPTEHDTEAFVQYIDNNTTETQTTLFQRQQTVTSSFSSAGVSEGRSRDDECQGHVFPVGQRIARRGTDEHHGGHVERVADHHYSAPFRRQGSLVHHHNHDNGQLPGSIAAARLRDVDTALKGHNEWFFPFSGAHATQELQHQRALHRH
jgi:hypothetical protein